MKRSLIILKKGLIFLSVLCLAAGLGIGTLHASETSEADNPLSVSFSILKDPEFNNVWLDISVEDFNALGFTYGDSINVEFSNGFELLDIPYFNGYYTGIGEPLLCSYPGYKHPTVCYNFGTPMWEASQAEEGMTVTVTMNEPAEFLPVQELYNMEYSLEKAEDQSVEEFANFRVMKGGQLKENLFYRSASPCDDANNRAEYANMLAEQYKINMVMNLAESEEELTVMLTEEDTWDTYYAALFTEGKVLCLDLNANYRAEAFASKIAHALLTVSEQEGPVLIHCQEGKDRTGFVCLLIEALAGASYQELREDYMITYQNYYGITRQSSPEKYEAIVSLHLNNMLSFLVGEEGKDFDGMSFEKAAEDYLEYGGLEKEEIERIKAFLINGRISAAKEFGKRF